MIVPTVKAWGLAARALAGLALAGAIFGCGAYSGHRWVMAEWNAEKAAAAEQATAAAEEALAEQHHRQVRLQEIQDANHRELAAANLAARNADAAAVRLRDAIATLRRANPPTAGGSAPAGDPIGVLADVLGRADARAGELARIADERGAAGAACERAYDALTTTRSPS